MMQVSKESLDSKKTVSSTPSWLVYGAQILTIFFALSVLTGRIYTISYWNVFALPTELNDTPIINYAIISIDATVASMFIAVGTVVMIVFIRRQPYDLVGNLNPSIVYVIGWLVFSAGLSTICIITKVDLSTWTTGTVGIVFGLAYFFAIGGETAWIQAAFKRKKELSKWDKVLFGWLKKVPPISAQIFFMVALVSLSLWAIFDTAQQFGANEAKFMYNTRPMVSLQLDSPIGFEDLALTVSPSGAPLLRVKIIAEDGEFLYVSPGILTTSHKLQVRAVPVSRVLAIQYEVGVAPIGK